jgi:hypothetical protein
MIYRKEANFPYPVLTANSNYYKDCSFSLDIDLSDDSSDFFIDISYILDSEFLLQMINEEKAQLVLVIQSRDNKFYSLKRDQKSLKIPKSRLSLNDRITMQLLIKAIEDIQFAQNEDLIDFYFELKEEITAPQYGVLAFSNTVIFDGRNKKPLELFERKVDPTLKSDIMFQIDQESIIICYKNDDLRYYDANNSATLNNHYIYMGLQKALYQFINDNGKDQEVVYINEIEVPEHGLYLKLYNLLVNKKVEKVSTDNVDEVIYKISDKIIEKHMKAVKRLYQNED